MKQIKINQLWMDLQALDPLVLSGALIMGDFCLFMRVQLHLDDSSYVLWCRAQMYAEL